MPPKRKSKTGTKSPSKAKIKISIGLPPKTSRIAREDHASRTFSAQNIAFVSDNLPLSGRSLNRIAVDKFIHGASRPQTRSVETQTSRRGGSVYSGSQPPVQASSSTSTREMVWDPVDHKNLVVGSRNYTKAVKNRHFE